MHPIILIVPLVFFLIAGTVAAMVSLSSARSLRRSLTELQRQTLELEARIAEMEVLFSGIRAEKPEEEIAPPAATQARETVVEWGTGLPEREAAPGPSAATGVKRTRLEQRPTPGGEPPRPGGTESRLRDLQWWEWFEESVGKRWMTWGGALALFISAGFFLKYAFENQWLGPTGRVVLGLVAGGALLVTGDGCVRREMRALGQGILGGGLAILYVSVFAAFSFYELIPQIPAFGAMVILTAAGMSLAIMHDSIALGFLAVLGGFLTPLMMSTGQDARDSLFAYLTLLNFGVLGIALFRKWRALDVLAFAGTWLLFAGWFWKFYHPTALAPSICWVSVFFLTFLVVPVAYQIRSRSESSVEGFLLALANAVIAFGYCYWMLRPEYQYILGFVALAMAASYIVLGSLIRQRVPSDSRSLLGFVGLSVVFLTLAVPLHLKMHGITLTWAVEGPVLLYLGYLYRYRPVRIAGFVVLVLAAWHLFTAHWPLHHANYVLFFNRYFFAAMSVSVAGAVYAIIHHVRENDATEVDRYLKVASAIAAGALALLVISGEVSQWLQFNASDFAAGTQYLTACSLAVIWASGSLGYLATALKFGSRVSFYTGLGALFLAALLSTLAYWHAGPKDYYIIINLRFFSGCVVAVTVFAFAVVANGWDDLFSEADRAIARTLAVAAGLFPLWLLSHEAYAYCLETVATRRRARWSAQMALSIVWGTYAVLALGVGFWRRIREVRIAALALLVVVAAKVVLVDMAQVQQIFRIISFVVLGLAMISASYLYHRLEKRVGM